jgi:hypothetical protein
MATKQSAAPLRVTRSAASATWSASVAGRQVDGRSPYAALTAGDPEFARNARQDQAATAWSDAVRSQQFQPEPDAAASMPEPLAMLANAVLPYAASALNAPGAFQPSWSFKGVASLVFS